MAVGLHLYRRNRRGVSLIELAIVLGVVGVVLGGIWSVANQANSKSSVQSFSSLLQTSLNAVRGVYSGQSFIDSTDATIVTPKLIAMNAFGAVTSNAFGSMTNPVFGSQTNPQYYQSIYACGWLASGSVACSLPASGVAHVPLFAIEAVIPAGQDCINAVMQDSSPALLPGLVDISINAGLSSSGQTAIGAGQSLPVTLAWAKTNCVAYNGSTKAALVDFVFKMAP